jgi:hypothetical protein
MGMADWRTYGIAYAFNSNPSNLNAVYADDFPARLTMARRFAGLMAASV